MWSEKSPETSFLRTRAEGSSIEGPRRVRLLPLELLRRVWDGPCCRLGSSQGSGLLLNPRAPRAGGTGAPLSDCSLGLPFWLLRGGPEPALTGGASAEEENLASSVAAPQRRGPTFSGMFSVHILHHCPFASCKGPTPGSVCMRDASLNRATPAAGGPEACHWGSGGQAGGHSSLACPKGVPPPVGA